MTTNLQIQSLREKFSSLENIKIFNDQTDIEKFSKDFYNYSPILTKQLSNCLADLVVKPTSIEAILAISKACKKNKVPLTIRGSGTGNYGQCVPLNGGVVMLMGAFKEIRSFRPETGEITVEAGCTLRDIEITLNRKNRQLRLMPSTWRSASIGGFIAGGSGGIGSVRWGFLRDPGHLLGIEVVTVEDDPKILQLDATNSEALNHAYGTNGIITALTIATAPLVRWQQVAIDCDNWSKAVELLKACVASAIDIHLCTLLEDKIVANLPDWSGEFTGKNRLLILVAPDGISTLKRLTFSMGASISFLASENLNSGKNFRELSWNHTTLHMRAIDTSWTYLQMLLPKNEIEVMEKLKSEWKDDLLWHLEAVYQSGSQRIACLPLVKWKDNQSMEKLINQCKELGAVVFNPHAITVEDGGLGVIDGDQVSAKKLFDPTGILNPGKLKGWV